MTNPQTTLAILLAAYLLGSVPFGLILTRLAGAGDIRQIGSGNIGATNVLRTGKKWLALLTLLLDGCKGLAAVLLTMLIAPDLAALAGLAALLGHIFPVWLRFRGGKGVATSLGIMFGVAWPVGIASCVIWLIVAAWSRYSSLAALAALGLAAPLAYAFGYHEVLWLTLAVTALVYIKHAQNIGRLLNRTESKISLGNKP